MLGFDSCWDHNIYFLHSLGQRCQCRFFLTPSHINYQCLFSPFLGRYKLSKIYGAYPHTVAYGYAPHVSGGKGFTSYATGFSHYSCHDQTVIIVKPSYPAILILVYPKLSS
uniref:Uncharacterized protein n=1 Tax=Rhipicephalus zambeziensis TaxID=60191 RepID=A0A224YHA7_9ACAR